MKIKTLLSLTIFLCSCAPQYAQDPNAYVLVTSQYEDEPERIVISRSKKSQYNCGKVTGARCALALYDNALTFITEAEGLVKKKLYMSARLSYMQALTRLTEAKIRLDRSKTVSYKDYKIAVTDGFEDKVKNTIKLCERQIFLLQWNNQ
jgi:hypothetical protein